MVIRKHQLTFLVSLMVLPAFPAVAQGILDPIAFTRNYAFPPVGLAGTETLQINVVNTAAAVPNATAAGSCAGTISFANASGTAIGTAVKFTVGAGQIFSAPLPFAKTGYASRGEILASIQQTVELSSASGCSLAISLETFDTGTGVTHVVLSLPASGALPILGISPVALSRE